MALGLACHTHHIMFFCMFFPPLKSCFQSLQSYIGYMYLKLYFPKIFHSQNPRKIYYHISYIYIYIFFFRLICEFTTEPRIESYNRILEEAKKTRNVGCQLLAKTSQVRLQTKLNCVQVFVSHDNFFFFYQLLFS